MRAIRIREGAAAMALLALAVAAGLGLLPGAEARAATQSVAITNFAFTPANLTVAVGDTVVWTNNATGTPHTVTSTDSSGALASGNLAAGATYSKTFAAAGTFAYACSIHPQMVGSITVTQAAPATTAPNTTVTSGASPAAPRTGSGLNADDGGVSPFMLTGIATVVLSAAAGALWVARRR